MKKREKYILFFLFLFLLVIRLYHLGVPPLEIEESWRQADTESMAWNFVQYDYNLFRPNLNYDGPLPNIPALEIQVTTYLTALLYKVFGHYYFLARLVPMTFFLISAGYLYLFARLYLSWRGAVLSVLIYGTLPINIYYSRAIMPESAALMFWLGGIYYFNLWVLEYQNTGNRNDLSSNNSYQSLGNNYQGTGSSSLRKLIISSILFSLAVMTKPPVIFAALPMLYLCYKAFGRRCLKFKELWGYTLVTSGLPLAYYCLSTSLAEYKFTLGISRDIIMQQALTAFYSPAAIRFYLDSIPPTLGMVGFLLILAGILALSSRQKVILVWFIAMVLEVIFIVSTIRAVYYLVFFTVPCALLIGNLLDRTFYQSGGIVLSVMLMLALLHNSYGQVKPMYTINQVMAAQVKAVQMVTARDDLLVVGSFDPCLLSLADRRGWRYNLRIYSFIPEDPYEEIAYYQARGAKYFVPIQGKIYGDEKGRLKSYLEHRFPKIEPIKGYPVYILR